MLCKIIDREDETQPIAWRRLDGQPSATIPSAAPARGISPAPAPKVATAVKIAQRSLQTPSQIALATMQERVTELEEQLKVDTQQARQGGMEQGFRKGREEAAAEMQSALDRLAKTIHDLAQLRGKIRSDSEAELIKLALSIAKRVLHREISADPQSLQGIVHAALQQLQNREMSRIRVFPAGVQAVRAALDRNGKVGAIEITPDPSLEPGDILFETSLGELDASVDTQLKEIERGFADRLQR